MKLYVIGNGFDRAHDLKTQYWDFRTYLKDNHEDFLTEFEKLYGHYSYDLDDYHISDENKAKAIQAWENNLHHTLWNNFEISLGYPTEEEIETTCECAIDCMNDLESGPVEIEETLNEYFRREFGHVVKLQEYLLEWAEQIDLTKAYVKKKAFVNNDQDLFFTFNYTSTLEEVYKVDEYNICHIHGGVSSYCGDPVIGHGNRKAIEQRRKMQQECDERFDECGSSMNGAFADFYENTFKDTEYAIRMNLGFFDRIKMADSVEVIGHSIGEVDLPYFKEILSKSGKRIPWRVYYKDADEKEGMEKQLRSIGVTQLEMLYSDEFWDK